MRSSKEAGCFPYRSKQYVCFMELTPNGELTQLFTLQQRLDACMNAKAGKSKIVAVWPGQYRSDLFIIDDLDTFYTEQYVR